MCTGSDLLSSRQGGKLGRLAALCLILVPAAVIGTGFSSSGIDPIWQNYASEMGFSSALRDTGTVYMVAMRDSVRLWTKVFLPDSLPSGGLPTLLLRTPYKFTDPEHYNYTVFYEDTGRFFAEQGYAFALQDCRGRFGSEGVFDPYACEFADGQDATQWIVSQPWSNGDVGTLGGSYDGFTALAAAVDNPHIRVVIADDAAQDIRYVFRDGAVGLGLLAWLYILDFGDWPSDSLGQVVTNALDVAGLDQLLLGRPDPFWQGFVGAGEPVNQYWEDKTLCGRYQDISSPVLSVHYTGSSDLDHAVHIWRALREEGSPQHTADQRLVVTPEDHTFHIATLPYVSTYVNRLMMTYIDKFLRGSDIDLSDVPTVQYRARNDEVDIYQGSEDWPPAESSGQILYLRNTGGSNDEGVLGESPPDDEAPDELATDPSVMDPYVDYPEVVYTSTPLAESFYVAGAPTLDLYVSATTPDADFFAYLVAYHGGLADSFSVVGYGGFRARYHSGFESPSPLPSGEPVHIQLGMFSTAHVIPAGSELALIVTAGRAIFSENPLTGEPLYGQTHWLSSTHKIWHDGDHRSRVTLPVRSLASEGPGLKPERVVLNAYPNPFERSCLITTSRGDMSTGHMSLDVFDMMGRRVWTGGPEATTENDPTTYRWIPGLSVRSGLYVVRVAPKNGNAGSKRVVYLR